MINESQISRNLRAFYVSRVDLLALVLVGVIQIWTNNGLDLTAILWLQGIFGLFVMLLEFPSGVLADLTKRKYLLSGSQVFVALGVLTYLVTTSFPGFVLAEFFFSIGLAANSGADTAFIYDTFLEVNQKSRADAVLATAKSLNFGGLIIGTILGGLLVAINWRLPLILAALGYLVIAYLYLVTYEPDRQQVASSKHAIGQSLAKIKNIRVLQLGLGFIFLDVFLKVAFWDYLPALAAFHVNPVWFGVVLAGANLVALISSLAVKRFPRLMESFLPYFALGLLGLLLFISPSGVVILLLAIVFHQIYRGAYSVIYSIQLNEQVSSEIRASVASLISAASFGIYFLVSLLLNRVKVSSRQVLWINLMAAGLTTIIVLLLQIRYSQRVLPQADITTPQLVAE